MGVLAWSQLGSRNWEYAILLIKQRNYDKPQRTASNALGAIAMTRQSDFLDFSQSAKHQKISAKLTPREGNPDRVLDLVRLLEVNPNPSKSELGLKDTSFDHVLHLTRLLGFIDDKKRLTKAGRGLLSLGKSGQYSRLALSLDQLDVVQSWCHFYGVNSFCELDVETCGTHLRRVIKGVKKTTIRGRITALKRLCKVLSPHHPSIKETDFVDLEEDRNPSISDEPVFGDRVLDVVTRIKTGATNVRISTGWMSAVGYDMVARGLREAKMKIMLGSDDYRGKELLESPLDFFKKSVKTGRPSEEKRRQHMRLYQDLASGTKRIRELHPRILDRLHAKGYYFGLQAGLSTSANMTWNGLVGNVESGFVTTSLDHMRFNITEFERYFSMAEDITTPIIEAIEESWVFQEPVIPYLAYLRGLLEVFGTKANEKRSETYHLADFQQMIVASALNSLAEYRRAMVISPTGTGKTVMGSYIIAAECMEAARKVVVFSPNEAVRHKWEHDTLAFGRTPRIYSHSDIQGLPENHLDSKAGREFDMFIDEETLVVVDEVHRFRTEGRSGEINLRRILDGSLNGKKPRALFLTATPIGTGFENLETQYSMLFGDETLRNLKSIATAPGLVNITLPFIMNKFGHVDENGHKYLNYANSKKYFGKRTQYITPFANENGSLFERIADIKFTRLERNPVLDDGNIRLDQFGFEVGNISEVVEVENMALAKLNLARAVNSSQSAAIESITSAIDELPEKNYAKPESTEKQLRDLLRDVRENYSDEKYQRLCKILRSKPDSKILIFTSRKATMGELVSRLSHDFPKMKIAAHEGNAKQKRGLRERFAPSAHGIKVGKRKAINVLVSTDSISEGVDLQDASTAIDYDLWWTPLKLQQRMGRLDRPTDQYREFKIIRFVNLTPSFTSIVKMDEYLTARSEMLKQLIADGAYEKFENRDWSEEHEEGIILVEEDGYESISSSEELTATSFHIADIANATSDDIQDAKDLPSNFVSSLRSDEAEGTFILFKHHGITHLAYKNGKTNEVVFSPLNTSSENVLAKIRCKKSTPLQPLPSDHYELVDGLLLEICELLDYEADEIELIFSVAIRTD